MQRSLDENRGEQNFRTRSRSVSQVQIADSNFNFRTLQRLALTLIVALGPGSLDRAHAVPAYPHGVEVRQPDGTTFVLRQRGDEYFSWHETAEGYVVVKDGGDGFWKYARPAGDAATLLATPDARVGSVNSARFGMRRTNVFDARVVRERVAERRRAKRTRAVELPIPGANRNLSPSSQPETAPPARIPVSGTRTIRNVVLLACFSDHWNAGAGTVLSTKGRVNAAEYQNLFNEVNHTADGAVGSVRDYYSEVSYGKLTVQSVVSAWVRLPQTEAYYGTDYWDIDDNWEEMIMDAIDAADAAGFDFTQGDSDGDGWVDCLTIIHSGHGQEYTGNPSTCIWSQQGSLTYVQTLDGIQMSRCHTEPALRGNTSSTSIVRIGVFCHEMGHFFGLPDLYDYSDWTLGIGSWGLMASGAWNGDDGKRPAHFCAWSKCFLGFVNPIPLRSQIGLSLPRVEDNRDVKLVRDGMSNGEYFLVENRARTGFDNDSAIYPGTLIYHVDTKSENNDYFSWDHPVVKIEEADGDDSLGQYVLESEPGDAWTSSSSLPGGFRDQTGNQSANAMLYQSDFYLRPNNPPYYSYITLSSFSAAGSPMTCNASTLTTTVNNQTAGNPSYTVSWAPCSQATRYEIQEGARATLTSFSDSAEDDDATYENWFLVGSVRRDPDRARTGSYSYAMHQYYDGVWQASVQVLSTRNPFKVKAGTVISFYFLSHLSTGNGYLKCQISNDDGNTWKTLGTYDDYVDAWAYRSYNYAALNAQGISADQLCLLRFVANFENASGWPSFPGYGYALDDISLANVERDGHGAWTTLNNNVTSTSFNVTDRSSGIYAYRVRAYANAAWQSYGAVGETTVTATNLPVAHFAWDSIAPTQHAGAAFPVTITAHDTNGQPATTFNGSVRLSAFATNPSTNRILGSITHSYAEPGDYTLGYSFTPNVNLTVTHVRHYCGNKVSLWTAAGGLLASKSVVSTPGTWVETQLPTPVELQAGNRYVVALYAAGNNWYCRYDGGASFPNGLIDESLWTDSDAFPTYSDTFTTRYFVDLRYTASVSLPLSLSPTNTDDFTDGVWSGNVALWEPEQNVYLHAEDDEGHAGDSASFTVLDTGIPTLAYLYNKLASTLEVSWNGTGWRLQEQTNGLHVPTGWYNYPNGSTSPVVITVQPNKPTAFYRLVPQ